MSNTLQYITQKRYGVALRNNSQTEGNDIKKISPQYKDFMDDNKRAHNHPYSRCDFKHVQHAKHGAIIHHIENRREKPEHVGRFQTRPFAEYYNPQKCIDEHNRYWRGIHTIGAINMQ